jgi:hypothetical protein
MESVLESVLAAPRVTIRPGRPGDAEWLREILAEPVVEIGGRVAGGIQYSEEDDPMYRHAGSTSTSAPVSRAGLLMDLLRDEKESMSATLVARP